MAGATARSARAMEQVVVVAGQAGSASRKVLEGTTGIGQEAAVLRAEVERFMVMVQEYVQRCAKLGTLSDDARAFAKNMNWELA